jgi:hypothetical protein
MESFRLFAESIKNVLVFYGKLGKRKVPQIIDVKLFKLNNVRRMVKLKKPQII